MSIEAERAASRLQEVVERYAARRNIPHVVLGVETVDGSFRWAAAAGTADANGTPMRVDTPVCLASITKVYTATVVLRLVEQGRLGLDDRLIDHLSMEVVGGIHRLDGIDHTDRITIRNLLGHTSGLPDDYDDAPKGGA